MCKKAELSERQIFSFQDSTGRPYIYHLVTKKQFRDKPALSTLLTTLEAMKSLAGVNGVSTVSIPKLCCGVDQTNCQEIVHLLRDVSVYSDILVVVYTLESRPVPVSSSEGHLDFYADDEK